MTNHARFIGVDLGAGSGRVMAAHWDGARFSLEEIHRFGNGGVLVGDDLYWDILNLWSQVQTGLARFAAQFQACPDSIGIDGWGVDYGLLDENGRLLGNPRHYRDRRTDGVPERTFRVIPEEEIFRETGINSMFFNTLFQVCSMVQSGDAQLKSASTLLMIPDLFRYFLSGVKNAEYTNVTTTQMFSREGRWAISMLERLGIPTHILPTVVQPGTASAVHGAVLRHCGFEREFPVIAVASHDTASAVAAIPHMDANSAFISSGTWSLMGVEVQNPNTSREALRSGFTNEGGADGRFLLLKNLSGLWTIQECFQHWQKQGRRHSWNDVVEAAASAAAFRSIFDPNDARLQVQTDMPRAIQDYCGSTRQEIPQSVGAFARSTFESLALKYRSVLHSLESLTGHGLSVIRVVGGGSMNRLLCQMIADACERPVVSGPAEASALGNVMMQAIATRHLPDLQAGRLAIAESVECVEFEPRRNEAWLDAYERFQRLEVR